MVRAWAGAAARVSAVGSLADQDTAHTVGAAALGVERDYFNLKTHTTLLTIYETYSKHLETVRYI